MMNMPTYPKNLQSVRHTISLLVCFFMLVGAGWADGSYANTDRLKNDLAVIKNSPKLEDDPQRQICSISSATAERMMKIPAGLMQALTIAESGRWDEAMGRSYPWPWTVMAENRGRYFASKAEAVEEVRGLLARGITNIDVGCMQINLGYHGKAFDTLDQAFDPIHNVAYAATFLRKLQQRRNSWSQAVRYYHSGNRQRGGRYREKIFQIWKTLRDNDLIINN